MFQYITEISIAWRVAALKELILSNLITKDAAALDLGYSDYLSGSLKDGN